MIYALHTSEWSSFQFFFQPVFLFIKSSDTHSLPYQLSRAQSQLTNGFEVQTSPEVQRSLSCISHSASFSPLEYCNTFLTSLFFAVRTYIQDGLCAARPFASHSSVLLPLLNFSSCISPPFNCSQSREALISLQRVGAEILPTQHHLDATLCLIWLRQLVERSKHGRKKK